MANVWKENWIHQSKRLPMLDGNQAKEIVLVRVPAPRETGTEKTDGRGSECLIVRWSYARDRNWPSFQTVKLLDGEHWLYYRSKGTMALFFTALWRVLWTLRFHLYCHHAYSETLTRLVQAHVVVLVTKKNVGTTTMPRVYWFISIYTAIPKADECRFTLQVSSGRCNNMKYFYSVECTQHFIIKRDSIDLQWSEIYFEQPLLCT